MFFNLQNLLRVSLTTAALFAAAMSNASAQRWMEMELGPTFSSTINNVPKGIAIRVGDEGEAGMLLDEDLLRVVSGWTGPFVKIGGGRNGLLANDNIGGPELFKSPGLPGIALPGKMAEDPRESSKKKAGPLPHDWARYKGLYIHGPKVVLSYSAGEGSILEHPWAETIEGATVFTRTLLVDLKEDHQLLIAEAGTKVAVLGKATLDKGPKDSVVVNLPAGNYTVKILIAPQATDEAALAAVSKGAAKAIDVAALTKGGPARYPEKLKTVGKLGAGDGPYVVDTITPPFDNPWKSILHFGGHDFMSDGTGVICTMEGDVWLVRGIDKDLDELEWQRIATGMYHPLGLRVVDDKIYVNCRDQLARLHDLNGDDEIDFYECFNNDIQIATHSHEFATGLDLDPDGNFCFAKGTNGGNTKHDSSAIKISKDGKTFTRYATGFRWPNGSGVSPDGVFTIADQQGTWVPASRLDIVEAGGFYGFLNSHHRDTPPTDYDGPLCWIPHNIDNSCGGQTWVRGGKWGPLDGKMIHLSYGRCLAFLVLEEKIGDTPQGGVIQIPVDKFESGAMRADFAKHDGQLYVSGLQGWQTSGARDGCFQRVRYTGKKVYLPTGLEVKSNGIKLSFAEPLDKNFAEDDESYTVEIWNYRWTKGYGSKQYKVSDPEATGHDPVDVTGAKLGADGKSVFIELADVNPVMQMSIRYDLKAADGAKVNGTIYNTIHVAGE